MTHKLLTGTALAATLSLSLSACGTQNPAPPEPDPAGLTNTVTGTLEGWGDRGTATIETQYQPAGGDRSKYVTLTKATVNADGSFSLALPGAQTVAPYLVRFQQSPREGCTGSFTQSVPAAQHFMVDDYALRQPDGTYIGFAVQDNPGRGTAPKVGDYFIQRIYADQAHTVTGTLSCPTFKVTLNLNLKPGWNAVVDTVNEVTADGKIFADTISTVGKLPASRF